MQKLLISALALGVCSFGYGQGSAPAKPAATPLEDGAAFMARVRAKLGASSTMSGTIEVKDKTVHDFQFKAMRPNFLSITSSEFEMHSTGTATSMYVPQSKYYMTVPPEMSSKVFSLLLGYEAVLGMDSPYQVTSSAKPTFFRGTKAMVVNLTDKDLGGPVSLYVDADTLEPIAFSSGNGQDSAVYKDVVLGTPMKTADFAWTPPADAKSQEQMMKEAAQAALAAQAGQANKNGAAPAASPSDPTSRLLKDGSAAPNFTLKTPTGGTLTLSKSLGKRATIINFWADFCGPCHAEMPLFVKLYKQLKPQGLELISVDDGDDAKTILRDAKENSFNYLLAMNGKDKMNLLDLYGVDAFPTNYILDANGKIITTIVGFDEDAVRAALKKAGFTLK